MILDSFSLSFWVIFRARNNLKYESIATILIQIIIITLGLIALKTTGEVKHLIMALLAASIFNFLFSLALIKFKLKFSVLPRWDYEINRYFLKIIPAFALAGIFIKIYNTSDSVLLSYLDSDEAVGFFAIPAKVVYSLQQIIPAAFAAVIFPAFSYYYLTSKQLLQKTFEKAFFYLTIISLPISAGIIVLVPKIIYTVWPTYTAVIPTFYIMSLAIPFIFLAFPTGYLLNACDRQRITTINRGFITAIAVILNIILIPRFSFLGAGITFFVTNFILLFLDFIWIKKIIPIKTKLILIMAFKSLTATIIMIIALLLIQPFFPLLIIVGFGILIYFISLYLLKGISLADFKKITSQGIRE